MKNYTSQVYKIIKELVDEYGEIISIKYLCEIAEVSRSGYYNYFSKKSIYNRMLKEEKEKKLNDIKKLKTRIHQLEMENEFLIKVSALRKG